MPQYQDLIPLLLFLAVLNFIGILAAILMVAKLLCRKDLTPDDPTGELKQKISDTLTKTKEDLEQTV